MFKIVFKTLLFTKEKQHYKQNLLYYRILYVILKWAPHFKYYLSDERPFSQKRGTLIWGRFSLNISRQNGGRGAGVGVANSMEALIQYL